MNKKRLSIVLAIFFLVQTIPLHSGLSQEAVYPLNPHTKVSLNEPDICFQHVYAALCGALFIYRLDAVKRYSGEALIRKASGIPALSEVRFDMEHIDLGKKGWTRYYPFSVGDRNFIARIFLTEERAYQPEVKVLFEANIKNPDVTFQILPGLSDILEGCQIKPHTIYPTSQVDRSP